MLHAQQKAGLHSSLRKEFAVKIGLTCVPAAVVRPVLQLNRIVRPARDRTCLLTVLAGHGRGEEVVAFLPEDGSNSTTTTAPNIKIYTMDGRQYSLPITTGITPVGDIRAFVSQKESVPVGQVRLAYAGRELDPKMDFQVFVPKPGIGVMHVMHRMSGGGAT